MGGVCVMLLGGKGGCQQCTCVPCDACTATCTQPHTGGAFGTVYTRYFAGVEAGNTTDGYLTATGDSDTSDPYDGMDGSGPWYQRVSGGFTLGGPTPGTRFPCSVRVSFWRNNYTLGASTIPPPGSTLTENTIEVIVTSGALVTPAGQVITPADGAVAVSSVPLVSGGGDASGSDPRTSDGTVSFTPQCWNVETTFTVRATIRWDVKKRQHVLYGLVRECYEIGTPCGTSCNGGSPPQYVYLTISNYTGPVPSVGSVEGTYVLERVPGFCNWYVAGWEWGCNLSINPLGSSLGIGGISAFLGNPVFIGMQAWRPVNGQCKLLTLWVDTTYNSTALTSFCSPGVFGQNTNGVVLYGTTIPVTSSDIVGGSFDWKIEA